jgi:hypothetical protein
MTMLFKKIKSINFFNEIVCLLFNVKTFFDNNNILHTFIITRIIKNLRISQKKDKNSFWKILTRFYDLATRVSSYATWCRKSEKLIVSRINHDAISQFAFNWFERTIWIFWKNNCEKQTRFIILYKVNLENMTLMYVINFYSN